MLPSSALLKQVGAICLFLVPHPLFSAGSILALLCPTPASGHHLHALFLPHSRAPESPRGELLHMSGALVFTPGDPSFVAATQGTPLDCLALEARGACLLGFHRTVTIRDSPCQTPGLCTDSRLKHMPSVSKRPSCLFRSFGPKGRLLVWHTDRGVLRE